MSDTNVSSPTGGSAGSAPARRLFLIDGYSNIFRAFYAIRNLSNSRGEATNAVFGFLQILRKLVKDERPEYLGVALDVSRKTVRSEKYAEYKANRAPMPEDLKPQIPWIRKVLAAYRIPIQELADYEADDVLGTVARKAAAEGYQVVLVSADKDLMQLVTPQISLYHTGRGKLYDPALVTEDFGVPPERVVDVLALMGDASDNVPGVPGIGEKGAKQLIQEYGDLDNLLAHAGELKRKAYREGLQEHRDKAEMSRELVTIHTDCDVAFEPDDLHYDGPDTEALRELFRELEFFSLLEELETAAPTPQEACPPAEELMTAEAWTEAAATLAGPLAVGVVAPEASGDLIQPLGLAVARAEGESPLYFADFRRDGLREAVAASVGGWLREEGRELVGHDLKEVLRLCPDGHLTTAKLTDVQLLSYVAEPARRHGLAELAFERLGLKACTPLEAGWGKGETPIPGGEGLLTFAGERVELPRRLLPTLRQELEGESGSALERIYREIEAPLIPVLVGLEEAGVLLDVPYLEAMSAELEADIAALEGEIYDLAGERFNIGSPAQLGVILFEKLGYPVLRRTRKTKNYATGAEILEELATRGLPLPERILRYRELTKLKSTYVDALPTMVGPDGRLHTRFNQAVAATGRLSSAHPNLQNIPVRTQLGQRIRKAFVARPGCCLLVADYSQVELRILAHIANEAAFKEAFQKGQDVHTATAARVFGMAPEMVSGDQRRAAKTINFGIIYGISAFGLARSLGIPKKQAESVINAYFERYPGVRAYVDETLARAEKEGKVETLYGRVRWLPDLKSKNFTLRENARRMAINARIQGTAADVLKIAMLNVDRRLTRERLESRLLLTVHDELMLEVPDGEVEAATALVKEEMEGAAQLDVPLVVETGCGQSWYDAK